MRSSTTLGQTAHWRKDPQLGTGVSIFFLAVGAVLTWAVNVTVQGLELQTVGVILMAVGGLGLVFSLLFLSSFNERRRVGSVVVEEREVPQ